MPSTKGTFITFEGGEGSGKSTQVKLLAENLKKTGHEVVVTREPGGTVEAEKIRELLVNRDGGNWSEIAECLLFFAARTMHVRDLIKPSIDEGKIVLCDRFTDSTRAYQSFGHGFPLEIVDAIGKLAIDDFEPDLTLILDINPEIGISRSNKRNAEQPVSVSGQVEDRFERLDISFHERLRNGYLQIAKENLHRCVVLDAGMEIDKLAKNIWATVTKRIK